MSKGWGVLGRVHFLKRLLIVVVLAVVHSGKIS